LPPESVSVRFVGLTGHKSSVIHLTMLAHEYPFDTVQLSLNCFDATYRSFEEKVLPELERRGIAALGMSRRSDRPVRQLAPRARPPHLSRV
jgi:aryl-alcohol dehydrogenase-like predicted oxidoreductase